MSVSFHRGLTHALKLRTQMAGVRIDEADAQRALAGKAIVTGEFWHKILAMVTYILDNETRQQLMKEWESENPNKKPFPPLFAEKVLEKLRNINQDDPGETIAELIALAEGELLFG